jgi:topoisomerase-4 subunit A
VPGPDFPTGGIIVETRASMVETYRTGRGAFRTARAGMSRTRAAAPGSIGRHRDPLQVQKGRLIEKIAELLNEKEAAAARRLARRIRRRHPHRLEPRARTVDAPADGALFKLSELEARIPLNMNVLTRRGHGAAVMASREVLRAWLDHRREVLIRRSRFRLGQIEPAARGPRRLLIAYLDLDEVIRIIREEDEPKAELMKRFRAHRSPGQRHSQHAPARLRKLEEMQLKTEFEELTKEKGQIEGLIASEAQQWKTISWDIREVKKLFGPETAIGKRRTTFADMPDTADIDLTQAMVEREPVTVVISKKGWIRALKGHVQDLSTLSFKGDDGLRTAFFSETTAKILVMATNGKVFTLEASKLPGGRGFGDPIRLMIELEESAEIVAAFPYRAGLKLLVATTEGRGFVVPTDDVVANTRKGKQVLNVEVPVEAMLVVPAEGDHVAIIGQNRKLLCFPISEVAEMGRGKGVRLQRYKDGGLSDAKVFKLEDGLTWLDTSGRTWTVAQAELLEWLGHRAEAGRLPPKGFPKNNKFGG